MWTVSWAEWVILVSRGRASKEVVPQSQKLKQNPIAMPSPGRQVDRVSRQTANLRGEFLRNIFSFGPAIQAASLKMAQWQFWGGDLRDHIAPLWTSAPLPVPFQSYNMLGKCNLNTSLFILIANP